MRLTELVAAPALTPSDGALEIKGITADSRAVEPGMLFAALPGLKTDGRRFAADAVAKGAVAILTANGSGDLGVGVPVIEVENPRRALALAAAAFYRNQPDTIVAVTGTNGKTSVASFCQQIWRELGHKSASMGTLGIRGPGVDRYGALTTPDPVALFADLAGLAAAGITHVAIEASSHGLDQYRLDGLSVSAAGFTNLSRDHLDYHPSVDAYFRAKRRLFADLLSPDGCAVLNADSDRYASLAALCTERGIRVIAYGEAAGANGIRLDHLVPESDGMMLSFSFGGRSYQTSLGLAGRFQAWNALCAFGLVVATGADPLAAAEALERLKGAPGRLEKVGTLPNGAPVYVDYAHTPDALETVLRAMRPHTEGRLVVVFGAGGDRDPGKRPMMGAIASANADVAYVTDDNPRSEKPAAIRKAILEACPAGIEIGDRRRAIESAIGALCPKDVLIVAGKGHEQGQIVGDKVLPFDDASTVREIVEAMASGREDSQ